MNEDNTHESLLVLIGELLYKNQLLREAIASKGRGYRSDHQPLDDCDKISLFVWCREPTRVCPGHC